MIIEYSNSHGLCYTVRHKKDGTTACYNADELYLSEPRVESEPNETIEELNDALCALLHNGDELGDHTPESHLALFYKERSGSKLPTAFEQKKIAEAAVCDRRTILKAYRGLAIREASFLRIKRAAEELGVTPPTRSAR